MAAAGERKSSPSLRAAAPLPLRLRARVERPGAAEAGVRLRFIVEAVVVALVRISHIGPMIGKAAARAEVPRCRFAGAQLNRTRNSSAARCNAGT